MHIQRNQLAHPPRLANAASIGLLVLSVLTCPPLPASKRRVLATKRTQDLQPVAADPAPERGQLRKMGSNRFCGRVSPILGRQKRNKFFPLILRSMGLCPWRAHLLASTCRGMITPPMKCIISTTWYLDRAAGSSSVKGYPWVPVAQLWVPAK